MPRIPVSGLTGTGRLRFSYKRLGDDAGNDHFYERQSTLTGAPPQVFFDKEEAN